MLRTPCRATAAGRSTKRSVPNCVTRNSCQDRDTTSSPAPPFPPLLRGGRVLGCASRLNRLSNFACASTSSSVRVDLSQVAGGYAAQIRHAYIRDELLRL